MDILFALYIDVKHSTGYIYSVSNNNLYIEKRDYDYS